MKRRIVSMITCLIIAVSMYAQGFRAYIQVTYSPVPRTVSIIVGDSTVVLKDSKGQPLQFNTMVAVLNWLSKKGWHLEPINLSPAQSNTFLMSRDNTTDKELENMFKNK